MRLLIFVILIIALSACGDNTTSKIINDINIQVQVEPNPPSVGEAILIVTLTDANGNLIPDATINIRGDMDHEGMTPVFSEADISNDGEYFVPINWSMGGGWIVEVTALLPGNRGMAQETFEFFVDAISVNSVINSRDTDTTGNENSTTYNELRIIIPDGTGALIEAGQEPDIIPNEIHLRLGSQNILYIVNNDHVDHTVGPFFIRSGESIRQEFTRPAVYEGGCSIHQDLHVQIVVES